MGSEMTPPAGRAATSVQEFARGLEHRVRGLPAHTALPEQPLAELRAVPEDADRAARFAQSAAEAGWRVHRVTAESWLAALLDIVRGHGAKLVLVEPDAGSALTPTRADELSAALAAAGVKAVTQRDDDTLFSADAAVTGAWAAIAETGTVVCASGAATARGASLIPPIHIALVSETQLVGDLLDFFAQINGPEGLPANVNLITGPSKTADIEGILITGVHGPGTVHVLLCA